MQVLLSICSLLTDPNPDDPLVPEIAHMCAPCCSSVSREELSLTRVCCLHCLKWGVQWQAEAWWTTLQIQDGQEAL